MRWRSHVAGGTVWTYEGARRLRPATDADRDLPVMGTWGYSVIQLLAEERFVGPADAGAAPCPARFQSCTHPARLGALSASCSLG